MCGCFGISSFLVYLDPGLCLWAAMPNPAITYSSSPQILKLVK